MRAFYLSGWMHSVVEAWAWKRSEEELVDRSRSPWDAELRRLLHAVKCKALQLMLQGQEIEAVLCEPPNPK